ncbi:MAG: threonylcarbamoyl-AMP synthase [Hyphomicrobiaceae bacterium]|nr:threonylcarbamoyl-AMP synthase [Hyphomicrobiaceae bacterium]
MPDRGQIKPATERPAVPTAITEASLLQAGELLRAGQLVAFPTETVYGLAADATNANAVARIFEAKGRPRFNPLIIHVLNLEAAAQLGIFSQRAQELAQAFWPGPLTLVVERAPGASVAELASAGLSTLALRVPAHPAAQGLLKATGRPLAAPSANRSGRITATTAQHVAEDLAERVAMILDAGPTAHGLESTVIDATGEDLVLLRPGAIAADAIEAVLGASLKRAGDMSVKPASPGQLESHYAPNAKMRLNASDPRPGEALLAFGVHVPPTSGPVLNLSPRGDLIEAAANLFAYLRKLDQTGAASIAVMPIPANGLGEAINDRLRRAAAPRPNE